MAASLSYRGSFQGTASSQTLTLTSVDFGTATNRTVLSVFIAYSANNYVTGVTIDGNTATMRVQGADTAATPDLRGEWWDYPLTSGSTSGNVVITWAAANPLTRTYVYALYDTSAAGPDDTQAVWGAAATASVGSLTVPTDGVGLLGFLNGSNTAVTWTNATEDADAAFDANTKRTSAASTTTAGTNVITADGANADQVLIGITYRKKVEALTVNVKNVAVAGVSTSLKAQRRLAANVKNIAATGQSVNLTPTANNLVISPDDAAVSGKSVALRAARRLAANVKNVSVTGQSANARAQRRLSETVGAVATSGKAVTLKAGRRLSASPANAQIAGKATELNISRLVAEVKNIAVAGYGVTLRLSRKIIALVGNVAISSPGVSVEKTFRLLGRSNVVATPTMVASVTAASSASGQVITSPTRRTQITQ